ncbi:MAG: hypothetical protein JJE04_14395 [Acidobacteriia bacterium]|nr:hypothetical protein [Terriglobia bacterium]
MPLDWTRHIVVRWPDPDPAHIPLLRQASIDAVVLDAPNPAFETACQAAGISIATQPKYVSKRGLWPGVQRSGNRSNADEVASASREPWLDANGYLVALERALHPERPAVLGYLAGENPEQMVPFESLELALVEARTAGGNYILSIDPRYRRALLSGDAKALAAWKSLGGAAAWLKQNHDLFGQAAPPAISALVEAGMPTSEIANLLYRRNASPRLVSASNVPPPAPGRILALVAASLKPPAAEVRARILRHAEAGSFVVLDSTPDPSWKLLKKASDRNFYSLGKGQVVAYHKRIADPSEFALDIIDLITHRRRPVRLWNALAVIPLFTAGRRPGEAILHLVNYSSTGGSAGRSPMNQETQARVQGHYAKAALLRPGQPPVTLAVAKRGSTSEVFIPAMDRLATVVFT